jgi:hypothetical protein
MFTLTDQASLAKEVARPQKPDDSFSTGLGDRCEFDFPSAYVIDSVFSVPLVKDHLPLLKVYRQTAWNHGGQIPADAEELLLAFRLHITDSVYYTIHPYVSHRT